MLDSIINDSKQIRGEMGASGMPNLVVITRWPSKFQMVRFAFNSRTILNKICAHISELRHYRVSEEEWENAEKVRKFLQVAELFTELQPGYSYINLSVFSLAFKELMPMCRAIRKEEELFSTVELMHIKITSYEPLVLSRNAKLARI